MGLSPEQFLLEDNNHYISSSLMCTKCLCNEEKRAATVVHDGDILCTPCFEGKLVEVDIYSPQK